MVTDPSSAALRAIAVLEAVAGAPGARKLSDLMAATGLAKSTVHRIAHLLEDAGLLVREPDGKRYAPGPRLSALALQVLVGSHWNAPRHAILQSLVQRLGETCNLTMLDGAQVVYLDGVQAQWPLRLSFQPGSRVPAHASASASSSGCRSASPPPRSRRRRRRRRRCARRRRSWRTRCFPVRRLKFPLSRPSDTAFPSKQSSRKGTP